MAELIKTQNGLVVPTALKEMQATLKSFIPKTILSTICCWKSSSRIFISSSGLLRNNISSRALGYSVGLLSIKLNEPLFHVCFCQNLKVGHQRLIFCPEVLMALHLILQEKRKMQLCFYLLRSNSRLH